MSKPRYSKPQTATEALNEITSALSALNMYPDPIEVQDEFAYICQTDANVKHSLEHIEAVLEYLILQAKREN